MNETIISTDAELRSALGRITFENTALNFNWRFEHKPVVIDGREAWLLWCSFERPDTITGVIGRGRGRDEIVWVGATLSGVVKTAWVLVKLLIDHELMEGFRFDGLRPFNPHNSVLDLVSLDTVLPKAKSA